MKVLAMLSPREQTLSFLFSYITSRAAAKHQLKQFGIAHNLWSANFVDRLTPISTDSLFQHVRARPVEAISMLQEHQHLLGSRLLRFTHSKFSIALGANKSLESHQ